MSPETDRATPPSRRAIRYQNGPECDKGNTARSLMGRHVGALENTPRRGSLGAGPAQLRHVLAHRPVKRDYLWSAFGRRAAELAACPTPFGSPMSSRRFASLGNDREQTCNAKVNPKHLRASGKAGRGDSPRGTSFTSRGTRSEKERVGEKCRRETRSGSQARPEGECRVPAPRERVGSVQGDREEEADPGQVDAGRVETGLLADGDRCPSPLDPRADPPEKERDLVGGERR